MRKNKLVPITITNLKPNSYVKIKYGKPTLWQVIKAFFLQQTLYSAGKEIYNDFSRYDQIHLLVKHPGTQQILTHVHYRRKNEFGMRSTTSKI